MGEFTVGKFLLPGGSLSDSFCSCGYPQLPLRLARRKRNKEGPMRMQAVLTAIIIALAIVLCLATPVR